MNLIEKLNEFVTPNVLAHAKGHAGDNAAKAGALSVFYPIFVAYLSKNHTLSQLLGGNVVDAKTILQNVFGSESQVSKVLVSKLAKEFTLPTATVNHLLETAAPLALGKTKELVSDKPAADTLKAALAGFGGVLPAWAADLLPAGILAGGSTLVNKAPTPKYTTEAQAPVAPAAPAATKTAKPAATHVNTTTATSNKAEGGGFLKKLLPIIGLLIFGGLVWLLLRSCQDKPAPVAAPNANQEASASTAAADAAPAVLGIAMDDEGKAPASCMAQAGSESALSGIRTALASLFKTDACQLSVSDKFSDVVPATEHLPKLLGLINGVPKATLGVADKAVRFGGADEATVAKLIADAKGFLPADFDVQAGTVDSLMPTTDAQSDKAAEGDAQPNEAAENGAQSDKPTEGVTAHADAQPSVITVAVDESGKALHSCRAHSGDEQVIAKVRNVIGSLFGADNCSIDVSAAHTKDFAASDQLDKILGALKGVPNASVTIADKTVRYNAANEADVQKLLQNAKAALPSDFVVEAEPKLDAKAAVEKGNEAAKNALNALNADSDPANLVKALNLQIINFASASSAIPAENQEILDLAVAKLNEIPTAHLKITGHTDSQGSYNSNKKLSESRANAVRDYLVSKGIAKERLETFGASSDNPVATNATEQGRFQNRRIEFSLLTK